MDKKFLDISEFCAGFMQEGGRLVFDRMQTFLSGLALESLTSKLVKPKNGQEIVAPRISDIQEVYLCQKILREMYSAILMMTSVTASEGIDVYKALSDEDAARNALNTKILDNKVKRPTLKTLDLGAKVGVGQDPDTVRIGPRRKLLESAEPPPPPDDCTHKSVFLNAHNSALFASGFIDSVGKDSTRQNLLEPLKEFLAFAKGIQALTEEITGQKGGVDHDRSPPSGWQL